MEGVTSYLCVVPPCVSLEFPSPPILASLSFLSAVWNSSVVQRPVSPSLKQH